METFLCNHIFILVLSMKVMDESQHNLDKKLIEAGHKMRCPRCGEVRDILEYIPLERPIAFEKELNPIYKCPKKVGGCSFLFSPSDEVRLLAIKEMTQ